MTNKPTGGQAYPSFPASINSQFQYQGMTMRDAFAIAALQTVFVPVGLTREERSAWAYAEADSMLSEREK